MTLANVDVDDDAADAFLPPSSSTAIDGDGVLWLIWARSRMASFAVALCWVQFKNDTSTNCWRFWA